MARDRSRFVGDRCKRPSVGRIRTMTSAGAVTAWRFLRRNPHYIQERRTAVARSPCAEGEPFPMRKQTKWTGKPRRVACSHGMTRWLRTVHPRRSGWTCRRWRGSRGGRDRVSTEGTCGVVASAESNPTVIRAPQPQEVGPDLSGNLLALMLQAEVTGFELLCFQTEHMADPAHS